MPDQPLPPVERISRPQGPSPTSGGANGAVISGSGRYVAFVSAYDSITSGDNDGLPDVFLYDRDTDTAVRLTTPLAGTTPGLNGASNLGISADGNYVVFESRDQDITASDDPFDAPDVFLYSRLDGSLTRVSTPTGSTTAHGATDPRITPDGRYVTFSSVYDRLDPADTNGVADTFVYDRTTGLIERVSAPAGSSSVFSSFDPQITPDGRFVVFESATNNLVAGDTDGVADVFIRDRTTDVTERLSVQTGAQGSSGQIGRMGPQVTPDGRYVVFSSSKNGLVPGDTDGNPDLFVFDRDTDTIERITAPLDATGGFSAGNAQISDDGRYVAFDSITRLTADDTNQASDVFLFDRTTDTLKRLSKEVGSSSTFGSSNPDMSSDGRYVVFESSTDNLVADTTGRQVYVYDRTTDTLGFVSGPRLTSGSDGASGEGLITPDGRFIVFNSNATNLTGNDTEGAQDIFVTAAVAPPAGDVTRPTLVSATVNVDKLVLTYDETLAGETQDTTRPFTTMFDIRVGGATVGQRLAPAVDPLGRTVTLTLNQIVGTGQTVTLSYVDEFDPNETQNNFAAIQDAAGNDALPLAGIAVQNLTAPPPAFVSATVNSASLILTYDGPIDSSHLPAGSSFAVFIDETRVGVSSVGFRPDMPNSVVVVLTASAVTGQVVKVSYTDPTSANDVSAIQNVAGNDAASLVKAAVQNGAPSSAPTAGPDLITLGPEGPSTLDALAGNDRITVTGGVHTVLGSAGSDTITAAGSADTLVALGGADNDSLVGGSGADQLSGGAGADTMNGGAGFDFAVYSDATAGIVVRLDFAAGQFGDALGDTFTFSGGLLTIEGVLGSNFNDTIIGDDQLNGLRGGAGNDVILGLGGSDGIFGDLGNDTLLGNRGADYLFGGTGGAVPAGQTDNDVFLFVAGETEAGVYDTILDFHDGEDAILLQNYGFTNAAPPTIVDVAYSPGVNAAVVLFPGNTAGIVVVGVAAAQLQGAAAGGGEFYLY